MTSDRVREIDAQLREAGINAVVRGPLDCLDIKATEGGGTGTGGVPIPEPKGVYHLVGPYTGERRLYFDNEANHKGGD